MQEETSDKYARLGRRYGNPPHAAPRDVPRRGCGVSFRRRITRSDASVLPHSQAHTGNRRTWETNQKGQRTTGRGVIMGLRQRSHSIGRGIIILCKPAPYYGQVMVATVLLDS